MRKIELAKRFCTVCTLSLVFAHTLHAQTLTVLQNFDGIDGDAPFAVVQGLNGNFFGNTNYGGIGFKSNGGYGGYGTLFEVTSAGALLGSYRFCSLAKCSDGINPGPLVLGADGNFYGATGFGGTGPSTNCGNVQGCGTIFRVTPDGKLTTLYDFCSLTGCADGWIVPEPLVQGPNGNLYGATFQGGTVDCYLGCGTIFEITPRGLLTTLHTFCISGSSCSDGETPETPLVLGSDGNFYGGANASAPTNNGTLFVVTPTGKFTTLHQLRGTSDGNNPIGLVAANDGNFYGTTSSGGTGAHCTSFDICGTVFKLTPGGQFTTLYNFCSQPNCTDGSGPDFSGLIQGSDGDFYGTTDLGGANSNSNICPNSCGVIFKITPAGQFTVLYNFCSQANCADGNGRGTLMQATDGKFYGASDLGGLAGGCGGYGCGTLFMLDMGLDPFVNANPVFGKTGYNISILGNNLTGATGVTFNGASATFNVVSDTLIKATVPTGATTGPIQVVTSSGTLSSDVAFRVLP